MDWSFVCNEDDVNHCYDYFCDNLSSIYDCLLFFHVKNSKRKDNHGLLLQFSNRFKLKETFQDFFENPFRF